MKPKVVILVGKDGPMPSNLTALETLAEIEVTDADGLAAALPGAEAVLWWDFFSTALADTWPHADALRWVHVPAAGVDAILFDQLRESSVTLTNAHGVFDQPIAEFVLASIVAHDKQLHRSKALQREGTWLRRELRRTAGSRALVVGTGGIGRAIGRLLAAVGMQVRGVGRIARTTDPDFETVYASDDLVDQVGWADHVVLVAPLTSQTRGLVDRRVLEAMKDTAHLVNVGRGALVVEDDLVDALAGGVIAAASLDVFVEEPLPPKHPLWGMENVHISAHMSGDVAGWRDLVAEQFEANLQRWVRGEAVCNVVDKQLGFVPRG